MQPPRSESEDDRTRLCHSDLAHDDLTGLAFGPYVLGVKLGGGGMGKVSIRLRPDSASSRR